MLDTTSHSAEYKELNYTLKKDIEFDVGLALIEELREMATKSENHVSPHVQVLWVAIIVQSNIACCYALWMESERNLLGPTSNSAERTPLPKIYVYQERDV